MFDVIGVGANSVDYVYSLPEFPHPEGASAKLPIISHTISCGGQTATALCACARMGPRTKYAGTIGNDANGRRITHELTQRGVDVEHVFVRQASNPFAVILLDERQGERVVLWNRDPKLRLDAGEVEAALAVPARLLHVDDADEDAAIRTAHHGRRAGIPVTSDMERVTERTEELVATVSVPIFAEHALQMFSGERDFERALRKVKQQRARLPVRLKADTTYDDMVCVTLGARGAMLLEGDRLHHVEGHQVDVVDTTGAGDIFRGAFIVALLRGDGPGDILRFANAAAALSCTRLGAINSVPSVEDVDALLRS